MLGPLANTERYHCVAIGFLWVGSQLDLHAALLIPAASSFSNFLTESRSVLGWSITSLVTSFLISSRRYALYWSELNRHVSTAKPTTINKSVRKAIPRAPKTYRRKLLSRWSRALTAWCNSLITGVGSGIVTSSSGFVAWPPKTVPLWIRGYPVKSVVFNERDVTSQ